MSDGLGAVAAARAAPWGRLETVQKVLTRGSRQDLGSSGGTSEYRSDLSGGQSGLFGPIQPDRPT